jgi:putative salt-induced outer membrane protein YdiY
MRIILTILILSSVLLMPLQAQINTEAMRKLDLKEGFYHRFSMFYDFNSGNTNLINLKTDYRTDYIGDGFNTFVIFNVRHGHQDDNTYINKGFLHWRFIMPYKKPILLEYFMQREYDDFLAIKNRSLLGGYIRMDLNEIYGVFNEHSAKSYFGSGLMLESSVYDPRVNTSDANLVRWANYLSFLWWPKDMVSYSLTFYFQPCVTRWEDYRFLADSKLKVNMTKNFSFQTNISYLYHNTPPSGIRKYDIEITNGIVIEY